MPNFNFLRVSVWTLGVSVVNSSSEIFTTEAQRMHRDTENSQITVRVEC